MAHFDEEEAMTRQFAFNSGILGRSSGLSRGVFPKTYEVKSNVTAWVIVAVGMIFVFSPQIIVPLLYGNSVWPLVPIWDGYYFVFIGCYVVLALFTLLCRVPRALERLPDSLRVHFYLRKVDIPLSQVEEVRMVRKWILKDSVNLAAKATPTLCSSCVDKRNLVYSEVGAPKDKVSRCFPFSLCDPCGCCDAKFFWGAPSLWGRDVCILSVRGATCNNYIFDLADIETFIKDNKVDYSTVSNGNASPPPQVLGMCDEESKVVYPVASPASTAATASPLIQLASPMSSFASPSSACASPLDLLAGENDTQTAASLRTVQETSAMSFEELRVDMSHIHGSSSENSPTSAGSPGQVGSPRGQSQ
jgi:hypothetical protein